MHIARHDPARVLADCEAKRRIVELCQDEVRVSDLPSGNRTVPVGKVVPEHVSDAILAHLALPYADHPDYRPEWRP